MTKQFKIMGIFTEAADYFTSHQSVLRFFWLANLALSFCFCFIPNGFSNPLSIAWLAIYYVYWCGFFRAYYHKKPYFLSSNIFGSMVPSTKIFFITFSVLFILVILPYLPLLMGFNDRYLEFFEKYMEALQNMETGFINQMFFGVILLFISPLIICRPFFAWIAALLGYNGSMRRAFSKTVGHYWHFVSIMFILNLPCTLVLVADDYLGCSGWLFVAFYSIFFIYFNLVFAKMYDFFYNE